MSDNSKLVVIMGPTGSGKSSLAMQLTEKLPCEIISADSMQVYKEMDIGTAKPSWEEQQKVKHHLIDILDIHQPLDVFFYVEKAKIAIKNIRANNKIPLIVGGSGMYIRALLYGLDPLPASSELQTELYHKYGNEGGEKRLVEDLWLFDPEAVSRFKDNKRKLLRAMEVFKLTGKSITQQQEVWEEDKLQYPVSGYYVARERTDLFDRIKNRTDEMLARGWIEETERLIKQGLLETPTAKQAIGYSIIAKYLSREISYDEMKVRIVAATKRYARRQETWFNNKHPEAKNFLLSGNLNEIVEEINKHYHEFQYLSE